MAGAKDEDRVPRWAPRAELALTIPWCTGGLRTTARFECSSSTRPESTTGKTSQNAVTPTSAARRSCRSVGAKAKAFHELVALVMVGTEGGIGYGPLGREASSPTRPST